METKYPAGPEAESPGLGNFLSGMETLGLRGGALGGVRLGNFLSGMETFRVRLWSPGRVPPWKLP